MSTLEIPITSVYVIGKYLNVKAKNVNIVQRITDGLDTASFSCLHKDYKNIDIGNTVSISLKRKGDPLSTQVFKGIIVRRIVNEEKGEPKELEIECNQLPDFTNRFITLGTKDDTQHNIIEDIIEPLTTDGIITSSIDVLSETVHFEKVEDAEIFETLRKFCNENTIDFYLDFDNNLFAKYSSDLPDSTLSLDQTVSSNPRIFSIEYVKDLDRVKNYVKIYGNLDKRFCNDLYTENSLGCWTFWVNSWDTWTQISGEFYPSALNEGTRSIRAHHTAVTGWSTTDKTKWVQGLRAECTFDSGTTINLNEGGNFSCYLMMKDRIPIERGDVPWRRGGSASLLLELYDPSGNTASLSEFIEGADKRQLLFDTEDFFYPSNFDWSDIRKTRFTFMANKVQNGETFGVYWTDIDILFDDLEFYTYWTSPYTYSPSESSFGLRELVPDQKYYDISNQSSLDILAQKLIMPYVDPEISPREILVEGNVDFKAGEKIYVKTTEIDGSTIVDGTFIMKEVEHQVTELDYKNRLVLASSRQFEPIITRELIEKERYTKIIDLSRRVNALEEYLGTQVIRIPYDQKAGFGKYEETDKKGWGDAEFDWTSITEGVTSWAVDQITQWLGAGAQVWKFLVQGLGEPFLKLFPSIGENIVYNGEFELDSDNNNIPDGWTWDTWEGPGGTSIRSSTVNKEGKYSAGADLYAGQIGGYRTDWIPVDEGKTYLFRAFAYSNNALTGGVEFYVTWADEDKLNEVHDTIYDGSISATTWTELYKAVGCPSGKRYARLSLRGYQVPADTQLYFDSVWMFKQLSWVDIIADLMLIPAKLKNYFFDNIVNQATKWANDFWQGATGIAKFIDDFWKSTYLSKFADGIWSGATGLGKFAAGLFPDLSKFGTYFPFLNFFNFLTSPWSGEYSGTTDSGFYLYPTTMVSMEKNLFSLAPTTTDQVAYIREYSTTTPFTDKTWVKGQIKVNNFGTTTVGAFGILTGAADQTSFKKVVFYLEYSSSSNVKIRGKVGDGTSDSYTPALYRSWNTWFDCEIRWEGTSIKFLLDGTELGTISSGLPSGDGYLAIWMDSYNSSNPTLDAKNPKRSEA